MDYELIDSGDGCKLERWGKVVLKRPDPQAIWKPFNNSWSFDAEFKNGAWSRKLSDWQVKIDNFIFKISISSFKHTGVFPEHVPNWVWLQEILKSSKPKVLNLFGYTGGATLAAARGGVIEVTHVDASKPAITRARENAILSELGEAPIRWIVDDAVSFVKREIKRGNKYDGLILDPPSFGRGAKGQVWKIEEDLPRLLDMCKEILSDKFKFILLNGYASGYSATAYAELLSSTFNLPLDKIEKGELFIKENSERGFILPAGIFARYKYG